MKTRGKSTGSEAAAPGRRLAALAGGAVRWWLGELAALVPAGIRRRFAASRDMLVLLIGSGEATVLLETGGAIRRLGRLDLAGEGEPGRRLEALLREAGIDRAVASGRLRSCVRLPGEQALQTQIELPLAAAANLDEVVSFELDRHTPFRADQVLLAARLLGRDVAAQRLTAEITAVPRATAERAAALAERLGIAADRLDAAGTDGSRAACGNLLPAARLRSSARSRRLVYALAAAAFALAAIAIYLPIAAERQAAAALEARFAAAKRSAVAAAALQKQIDELRGDEMFLIDRKRAAPTVSALLFETTRLLPDDTVLSSWQRAGKEVQLQGTTGSASALVERLERSKIFGGTTFRAPVTQDAATGRERFHLAVQVKGGGS